MTRFSLILLLCLAPATTWAGAQFTAEEIVDFFARANAASDASRIETPRSPGVAVNRPQAAPAPARSPSAAAEPPLVVPYTGVKAGYRVPPVPPALGEGGPLSVEPAPAKR